MEKERTIRIKDLIGYILKRWRLLLICMIIFAILLNGYSCLKSYQAISEAKNQDREEVDFSQYENKLSEKEILEVENAVESYRMYEQSYEDYKEYNITSIKMQLNANAVSTQKMIYQITSNQKDVVNISDALVEVIPSDEICKNILDETQWDIDVSYVKELINVTNTHMDTFAVSDQNVTDIVQNNVEEDTPVLITITILADSQDNCEVIRNLMEKEVNTAVASLQEQFGQFNVEKISDIYGVEANKDLLREQQSSINEMNNSNNSMHTLENNLTDDQKSYFSALVNEQASEEESNISQTEIPNMQYINVKYIIVGAALGIILCCFYAICRFFLDRHLLSPNYVFDDLKSEVLLVYSGTQGAKKKNNLIDKWLEKIFHEDVGLYTGNEKLHMLCAEIQIAEEKNSLNKIHISSSIENEKIKDFISEFSECLEKKNLEFSTGASIVSDTDSLEKFAVADGVIFVEQMNKSLVSEMNQELNLCNKYSVKNLGFILID